MIKQSKGITLIALIITIIILIILAGISISSLIGENGIITSSRRAKQETMLASIKEGLKLYYLEQEVNGTNEDPVTNKIPQDELTDEATKLKVVEYQNGVDFISDIKYDNLYYLDFNKINVSDVDEEQKYFMDIETNTVFINEGLKIIGTDT